MHSIVQKTVGLSLSVTAAVLPLVASGQSYNSDVDNIYPSDSHTAAAQNLVGRINDAILFPLMTLMTAVALLVFLWGAFRFVYNAGDEGGREIGKRHMIYGIIGLLVMVSAFTILQIAAGTFGIAVPN